MASQRPFHIGLTRDLLTSSGAPCFNPAALEELAANPSITWEWVPEDLTEVTPDIAARYDGLHVNLPRVPASAVARSDCRLKIVARNGVGYDSVDVPALAAKGIAVTNTPLAVRRPVAVATLTLLFALAGRLVDKDRLVHQGRWNDRTDYMGQGLTKRTLGIVGAGSIGQEIMRLARPFFGAMIAADPYADATKLKDLGCDLLPLDDVMARADYVVVCALLTPETRHLINASRLARMKRTAYLINVGRGPIVDEQALITHLKAKGIAGAGLDVTEIEPIANDNPLLKMDNVLITAHALCWTDECFEDIARSALKSLADYSLGKRPAHLVDASVWR
ncbi:MAG TPA: NAD(P)-dependent oxidoreductase [Hyphomicrobiaceae bacterium]|mgnify:CR=1 FL=1|nr:NAD(P)-dependent oxidoreductase [Hyphomicrobiaceae bacterium]